MYLDGSLGESLMTHQADFFISLSFGLILAGMVADLHLRHRQLWRRAHGTRGMPAQLTACGEGQPLNGAGRAICHCVRQARDVMHPRDNTEADGFRRMLGDDTDGAGVGP